MRRSLGALIFLIAFCLPAQGEEDRPPVSLLIVARPELPDRNFHNSVVLVTHPGMGGPLGVILNKPIDIPIAKLFPDVERLANLPDKLFLGGPVELATLSFVFRAAEKPDDALEIMEGVYFSTDRDLLRELLARDKPLEGLRIFAGYAGWAPGQLESEVTRGDWGALPVDAKTIFDANPQRLWQELDRKASATPVRWSKLAP